MKVLEIIDCDIEELQGLQGMGETWEEALEMLKISISNQIYEATDLPYDRTVTFTFDDTPDSRYQVTGCVRITSKAEDTLEGEFSMDAYEEVPQSEAFLEGV